MYKLFAVLLLTLSHFAFGASNCEFKQWANYKEVDLLIHKHGNAYLYTPHHMGIDADGAPNAYHPDDRGLDYLANAGYPNKSWWKSVLVSDVIRPSTAYKQIDGEFRGVLCIENLLGR